MHAYTSLISLCQRANQWRKAMQIFRRMEAADVKVDVVAYNSAIAACAKGGDWEQAWAVFSSKRLHVCIHVCICAVKLWLADFTFCVSKASLKLSQSHLCISRHWLQMSRMYVLSSSHEGQCSFLATYRSTDHQVSVC